MSIAMQHRNKGFSLIELIIAVVLLGLAMGTIFAVIVRQQRFYSGAADLIQTRSQIRQGASVLPSDLRPVYPRDGDIYAWSDTAIEFRAITGSTIVCTRPTTTRIVIPPLELDRENRLTAWLTQAEAGDSILVYDEGERIGNADDVWRAYQIGSIATVTGVNACPAVTNYTTVADAVTPSYVINLASGSTLTPTIIPGAPIRFFRRVRYSFYQESDDGWYLGYLDCRAGYTPACSDVEPVSGPYRPHSNAAGLSGLVFTYRNDAGTVLVPGTDDRRNVARIDITIRGETSVPYAATDGGRATKRDSLNVVVGLRNRH